MREDYNNGCTEATTSCTSTSPRGGYNGGNDLSVSLSLSLSHCHSLYSYALYTNLQKCNNNNLYVFPKSYLYIYDFRVIYTCVPSNRSDGSEPGLGSSGSPYLLIRRYLFPNRKGGGKCKGKMGSQWIWPLKRACSCFDKKQQCYNGESRGRIPLKERPITQRTPK